MELTELLAAAGSFLLPGAIAHSQTWSDRTSITWFLIASIGVITTLTAVLIGSILVLRMRGWIQRLC